MKLIQQLVKLNVLPKGTKIPSHFQDPQLILRFVLQRFFGMNQYGFYSSIEKLLDSPFVVPLESKGMIGHVLKIMDYYEDDYCLVKIQSGNVSLGSKFKILSEDGDEIEETTERQEEKQMRNHFDYLVEKIILMDGQYRIPIDVAYRGQLVLIKSQLRNDLPESLRLTKLDYINKSYFKVSVAPLQPRELPKLINGLDKVNKYFLVWLLELKTPENMLY